MMIETGLRNDAWYWRDLDESEDWHGPFETETAALTAADPFGLAKYDGRATASED